MAIAHNKLKSSKKDQHSALPIDLLDVILSIIFWIGFLCILLIFDIALRISIHLSKTHYQRCVIALNKSILIWLRVLLTKIEINGTSAMNLDPKIPYIIVSNHQSMFDIPILYCLFPNNQIKFIAKKELGKWIPSISFNLRNGGDVIINRSDQRASLKAIKAFARRNSEAGYSSVIFPEGTRSRTGQLGEFKTAGLTALIKYSNATHVIPVAINGSWKLGTHKLGIMPRGVTINITIGNTITSQELVNQDSYHTAPDDIESDNTESKKTTTMVKKTLSQIIKMT